MRPSTFDHGSFISKGTQLFSFPITETGHRQVVQQKDEKFSSRNLRMLPNQNCLVDSISGGQNKWSD